MGNKRLASQQFTGTLELGAWEASDLAVEEANRGLQRHLHHLSPVSSRGTERVRPTIADM